MRRRARLEGAEPILSLRRTDAPLSTKPRGRHRGDPRVRPIARGHRQAFAALEDRRREARGQTRRRRTRIQTAAGRSRCRSQISKAMWSPEKSGGTAGRGRRAALPRSRTQRGRQQLRQRQAIVLGARLSPRSQRSWRARARGEPSGRKARRRPSPRGLLERRRIMHEPRRSSTGRVFSRHARPFVGSCVRIRAFASLTRKPLVRLALLFNAAREL